MRPIQNAGGEETIRERSYPVAKATAITAGQVVQLSGGKVVPAAAAQTAAILGIAGEDHSGTADILNPRADGDEILVCDNPGLIFECPVPTIRAASGSAATLVPASGDIAAGAADDAYNAAVLVLSSNSDKPGTRRAVTDYAKSGTVLTLETGGTPAAGDEYELYPALGSAVCALNAKATALVVSATGATAVRCIGHDYERHTIRCIAVAHTLAAKS
mgnify:CR=1 FL=1